MMPQDESTPPTDAALIGQLHDLRAQLRTIDQAVVQVAPDPRIVTRHRGLLLTRL